MCFCYRICVHKNAKKDSWHTTIALVMRYVLFEMNIAAERAVQCKNKVGFLHRLYW